MYMSLHSAALFILLLHCSFTLAQVYILFLLVWSVGVCNPSNTMFKLLNT